MLFGGVEISRWAYCARDRRPGAGGGVAPARHPEPLRLRGPGARGIRHFSKRPEIDPKRIGVMGFSMGGYYAPRAAMEPRFAACLAWGGHWDYHESWVRRRKVMRAAAPSCPRRNSSCRGAGHARHGCPHEEAGEPGLAGVAERIRCPFTAYTARTTTSSRSNSRRSFSTRWARRTRP